MIGQEGTEEKGQGNGKTETKQKNTKYIDRDNLTDSNMEKYKS